jgi:hypothetical protein
MRGRIRLTGSVSAPDPCRGTITRSSSTMVDITLQQTLRLAGVMIGYNGPPANAAPNTPDITLPALGLQDLQATSAQSYTMFPVRNPTNDNYRLAGSITQRRPLTDRHPPGTGGCYPNWDALMQEVRNVVTADGNRPNWVYFGLLPNGIPMGPIVGCGGGGIGTGRVGAQRTMAHEIGHALGLRHAPCGNPQNTDPDYPAYEPYDPPNTPEARIGEYGLNITTGAIHQPTTRDFMSYCVPDWISLHYYRRLLNVQRLTPTPIPAGLQPLEEEADRMELQPLISIVGLLDVDNDVSVRTVARLETRSYVPEGTATELIAELLGEDGEVLASATIYRLHQDPYGSSGCCDDGPADEPPHLFQALIPDVAAGTALRIREEEETIWYREAPPQQLEISDISVEFNEFSEGKEETESSNEAAAEDVPITISWSEETATEADFEADEDEDIEIEQETWNALTVGVEEDFETVDISDIPAEEVIFQVLVHDGFYTTSEVSEPTTIPSRPPVVTVMHPLSESTLDSESPVRLWCIAEEATGETIPEENIRWFIGEKEVGQGTDVWIDNPGSGTYTTRVIVSGEEDETSVDVNFKVADTMVN